MQKRDIIVIGASAGGFAAIKEIVSALPADLGASIFIVWHMAPTVRSVLPDVLNRIGRLPVLDAADGMSIEKNHIYVALADHHLILEKGTMLVTKGPKENHFRPAVDPLLRSAALHFVRRVIGIVLSGALDDGAAGLYTIKSHGGIAIVQDPEDAEVNSMPAQAMKATPIDYKLPASQMGELLVELTGQELTDEGEILSHTDQRTEWEIGVAMEKGEQERIFEFGKLTPYTCPECHGVLSSFREGNRLRFRCHTGHAYSADTLLASIGEYVEDTISSAIRGLQESVMLLNHLGDHLAEENHPKLAALYFKKAKEADERANLLQRAIDMHEQLTTESIKEQTIPGNGTPVGVNSSG